MIRLFYYFFVEHNGTELFVFFTTCFTNWFKFIKKLSSELTPTQNECIIGCIHHLLQTF